MASAAAVAGLSGPCVRLGPGPRSRKAAWVSGYPEAKRARVHGLASPRGGAQLRVPAAAGLDGERQPAPGNVEEAGAAALGGALPAPQHSLPTASVLVAFAAHARLAFGEQLRLVGSCPELGGWDPAAAPAMEWGEGDRWAAQLALPPGQHAFKLVVLRGDGGQAWEEGGDRQLRLPELVAGTPGTSIARSEAQASAASPLLRVTLQLGDTASTSVAVDQAKLQAAAAVASARVEELLARKAELAARLAALEAEVEKSEGRIATIKDGVSKMVTAELTRLEAQQRKQLEEQQRRRAEQEAAAARSAAVLADATAAVQAAHAATGSMAAAVAAGVAHAPAAAVASAAATAAGAKGAAGSAQAPSSLQAAKQRLASLLPAEAGVAAGPQGQPRRPLAAQLQALQRDVAAGARQVDHLAAEFEHVISLSNGRAAAAAAASPGAAAAVVERPARAANGHSSSGAAHAAAVAVAAAAAKPKQRRAADPYKKNNLPGVALCLAAQSLLTLGGLVWSVGRQAVPAGSRRAADAAAALGGAAVLAVPFL